MHVICALFTEGVEFSDKIAMEPVNVCKVSNTRRNKCCIFCEKLIGYSMKCSKKGCRKYFHAMCAHENGSLSEELSVNGNIHFRGYCGQHKSKKRLSVDNVKNVIDSKRRKPKSKTVYQLTLYGFWA